MSLELPTFPERYIVLAAVGGGGGGNVFEVEDSFLQRKLALKLFDPAGDETVDETSFLSEFLLATSVSHPNLIKVLDFGYDAGNHPFFTMEFAEGEQIRAGDFLKNEEHFLEVLSQICSALGLLHHFGIFHNDLKPANIRVKWDGDLPTVKILDFGLARGYDPSYPNTLSGTVEYMAPEIFQSGAPSAQSDIYSLGIMLYELVTGNLPFKDSDPLKVISGHAEKLPPKIVPKAEFINDDCISLIEQMLLKNPDDRPQSTAEIISRFVSAFDFDPDRFSDDSIISYFDSSLAQIIRKSPEFTNAIASHKEGLRLGCTDSYLAALTHKLVRQTLQTEFVNVRISDDDRSFTSIHAPEIIDLPYINAQHVEAGPSPRSYIVDLANYGKVASKFADTPILKCKSILSSGIETTISRDSKSVSTLETIENLCVGSMEIARRVLTKLYDQGILIKSLDGFTVHSDSLEQFSHDSDTVDLISKQVDFLPHDKRDALTKISVIDHRFTTDMASAILDTNDSAVKGLLDEFTAMRILRKSNFYYRFRHQLFREALYRNLEESEKAAAHIAVAGFLAETEPFDRTERTGMLSRHYLLGNNIESGIKEAVEYQKLQAESGEFKKPESLLNLCEKRYRSNGLADMKLESALQKAFGDLYRLQGEIDTALERYNKIIEMPDVEPQLLAETYKHLGDIYKSRREFSTGLRALNRALEIFEKLEDQLEISRTLNNIGNIYWVNSEYDFALEKYESALKIQEKLGETKDVALTLNNIGTIYAIKRAYHTAIEHYNRSIEINKSIGEKLEIARNYNNIANIYHKIDDSGKTLNYLNRAVAINREIGAQKELMFNLENIAQTCMGLGKYKRVEETSNEGFALARQLDDIPHKGRFSMMLAALNIERGLYGKALEHLQESMELTECITDKSLTLNIMILKAKTCILTNALEEAKQNIDKAFEIASPVEINEENIQLKILNTWLSYLWGKVPDVVITALDDIGAQAEKRKLNTELCDSLVIRLDILAQQGRIPAELLRQFDELTDIDQLTSFRSLYYFYRAVAEVHNRMYDEALSYFYQAESMAGEFEQRELLWRIHFHIGKICMAQTNYEDAFLRLRQAGNILKEIADNIGDHKLIKGYKKGWEKLQFLDTVRLLTEKMT